MNNNNITFKKLAALAISIICGLTLSTAVAFAHPDNDKKDHDDDKDHVTMHITVSESGKIKLHGTVTAVSGSTINVSSWLGTWIVNAANADIVPKKSNESQAWNVSDIKVGDKVIVSGTVTSASGLAVTANKIHDLSLVRNNKVKGTVSNLNASAGTFTLETKNKGDVTVASSPTTKVVLKDKTVGSFSNLANGIKVAVSGILNITAKTMAAMTIKIK